MTKITIIAESPDIISKGISFLFLFKGIVPDHSRMIIPLNPQDHYSLPSKYDEIFLLCINYQKCGYDLMMGKSKGYESDVYLGYFNNGSI